MNKLTFAVNNGGILEISQKEHDGTVTVSSTGIDRVDYISNGDMVMLMNWYRYIKDHDIQNDFINPCGKNKAD